MTDGGFGFMFDIASGNWTNPNGKARRDPWLPAEDDAGEDLEKLRPTVWDPNDDDPARDDLSGEVE